MAIVVVEKHRIAVMAAVHEMKASAVRPFQSRRAVEIETLKAQAEVQPLVAFSGQLTDLKKNGGSGALDAYIRNIRLKLFNEAKSVILEANHE